MIEPAVWPRPDNRDDATKAFVYEVEKRDYELALFMAPAPIEDAIAWAGGSAPHPLADHTLPGSTSPDEAGLVDTVDGARDARTTDQLRLNSISSKQPPT